MRPVCQSVFSSSRAANFAEPNQPSTTSTPMIPPGRPRSRKSARASQMTLSRRRSSRSHQRAERQHPADAARADDRDTLSLLPTLASLLWVVRFPVRVQLVSSGSELKWLTIGHFSPKKRLLSPQIFVFFPDSREMAKRGVHCRLHPPPPQNRTADAEPPVEEVADHAANTSLSASAIGTRSPQSSVPPRPRHRA